MIPLTFQTRMFKKGDVLFTEGESAQEAYLIKKGQVSISREEEDQCLHLALRDEGDIVGEMALLDDTTRCATARAETDVEVDVLTKGDLQVLLSSVQEPLQTILHQLMESIRCSNDMIGMYACRSLADK